VGKCYNRPLAGQSLVEVVIAVGAMSVLLVALLSLMSLSLRNSRLAKDRARAVASASQGVELMRAYRDSNWNEFLIKANTTNYSLPVGWVVGVDLIAICGAADERCVQLSQVGDQVEVKVSVAWTEGSQTFSTNQVTQLSLWER